MTDSHEGPLPPSLPDLPREVWYEILHDRTAKSMRPLCRDVCRLWREVLPFIRINGRGPSAVRILETYRRGVCSDMASRGWMDCLKLLVGTRWYRPGWVFYPALCAGQIAVCQWVIGETPEGAELGDILYLTGERPIEGIADHMNTDYLSEVVRLGRMDVLEWLGTSFPETKNLNHAASRVAAERGNLEALKWMAEGPKWNSAGCTNAAVAAACEGNTRVLEWTLEHDSSDDMWAQDALEAAACAGRLETVKWLVSVSPCWWDPVWEVRDRRMKHTSVFKWAVLNNVDEDLVDVSTEDLAKTAAYHGNLECLAWMCEERGASVTTEIANHAVISCNPDVVEWVHERGADPDSICWGALALRFFRYNKRGAASVIAWLLDHGVPIPSHSLGVAVGCAACLGDAGIYRRLSSMSSPHPFQLSHPDAFARACRSAAAEGNLEVMKVMREQGMRLEASMLEEAARMNRASVFEWLMREGCDHSLGMEAEVGAALEMKHLDLAVWIDQKYVGSAVDGIASERADRMN